MVQFHGDEEPEFCEKYSRLGRRFIKAMALRDSSSCRHVERFATPYILLDAYAPGQFGGTGRTVDWDLAAGFVGSRPDLRVLLSGGLNPGNVRGALERVRPFGVDIASGVERRPGEKDPEMMRLFIRNAKAAEWKSASRAGGSRP
jgi:phosphoribosylanthranilate isomerase